MPGRMKLARLFIGSNWSRIFNQWNCQSVGCLNH